MEPIVFKMGDEYRALNKLTDEQCLRLDQITLSNNTTTYSDLDKKILKSGDIGQAQGLQSQKNKNKK